MKTDLSVENPLVLKNTIDEHGHVIDHLTIYIVVTQFTYGKLRYCHVKS